eukprot:TRINITY_DN575_c0_g1_i1.p1 TRINITY_DN575_c0_g1~~TRINITY_DN575_c0_g1_i1.p1  ORF type:complete len:73 (+),score=10.59 TRINITY_DN575_c0_g1_i1:915-1133(+)
MELSILCNSHVAIVVYDEDNQLTVFTSEQEDEFWYHHQQWSGRYYHITNHNYEEIKKLKRRLSELEYKNETI